MRFCELLCICITGILYFLVLNWHFTLNMSSDICDSSIHDGCLSLLNDAKTFPYHIMIQFVTSTNLYKQLKALSTAGK
jgi:hypothetical protein